MKKLSAIFFVAILAAGLVRCGGGTYSDGSTRVSVSVGQVRAGDLRAGIPDGVSDVRFTISSPDMETIERTVDVSGREGIVESFGVPNGTNRYFLVEALSQSELVLYGGGAYADLDGTPATLDIVMVPTDTAPPSFAGLSSLTVLSGTSALLSWAPAVDNVTPQDKIVYLIYQSESSPSKSFGEPAHVTGPGETSYTVTGLQDGTTYLFGVRARDEFGNIDENTVEVPLDKRAPSFAGIKSCSLVESFNERPVGSRFLEGVSLSWDPATDDVTPAVEMVYLIYQSSSTVFDFSMPAFITPPGATSFFVGAANLIPGKNYFAVRARDGAGNIDSNTSWCSPALPDLPELSISNVLYDPDLSELTGFSVYNSGTQDAVDFYVVVMYDDGYESGYCDEYIISVPAGDVRVFEQYWNAVSFMIIADLYDDVMEINEGNNVACFGYFCTSPPDPFSICGGW